MAPAATNQADPPALICVLPLNAAAEQVFEINLPGLELRTDQLVSFQACSSTRHGRCRPGDVLPVVYGRLPRAAAAADDHPNGAWR